jgi:hypothetical protein
LPSLGVRRPSVNFFIFSEEKIFLTLANQKQELPLVAIFVDGMGRNDETLVNSKSVNNIRNLMG